MTETRCLFVSRTFSLYKNANGSSVDRNFLYIKNLHVKSVKECLERFHRKIRKVFVIDKIKIVFGKKIYQIRRLNDKNAVFFKKNFCSFNNFVQIVNMCKYVIGSHNRCLTVCFTYRPCKSGSKKFCNGFDTVFIRSCRNILRRLDTQCTKVMFFKGFKKYSVITADINNQRFLIQVKPLYKIMREVMKVFNEYGRRA